MPTAKKGTAAGGADSPKSFERGDSSLSPGLHAKVGLEHAAPSGGAHNNVTLNPLLRNFPSRQSKNSLIKQRPGFKLAPLVEQMKGASAALGRLHELGTPVNDPVFTPLCKPASVYSKGTSVCDDKP